MILAPTGLTEEFDQKTIRKPDLRQRARSALSNWLSRSEWFVAAVILIIAIACHLRIYLNVGGLWRDEVNSVNIATLAHVRDIPRFLEFDSFPILYFGVLRGWTAIFGSDDVALRTLGLITGVSIIGALIGNARAFGARAPLLSLALLEFNPMFIRYGDSTRAFGLGILLILLTMRSFWRLVDCESVSVARRVSSAAIVALLSVHCLYYNSVLLLAISVGAIAVASRRRAWRLVTLVLAIGVVAAASLLPYVPMINRVRSWTSIVSYPVDFVWLWHRFCEVLGSPDPIGTWLWTSVFVLGLTITFSSRFSRRLPDPILFASVTCATAVPAYAIFLRVLSYYTQPWYYITLTGLVACSLDVVLGAWPREIAFRQAFLLRCARLVLSVALLSMAALPAWQEMPIRHTNVDFVAATLRSQTTKDDIVVATHWQYAVSLNRYYHGPAQMITLPFVEDHRFHRYDLALRQMESEYPLEPAFSRIGAALRAGHRAFFVGALRFPKAGELPPGLTLGYRDASGNRHGGNYDVVWPVSAGYFVQSHARNCVQIPVPLPNRARVQRYEYLALSMAEGWR